MRVGYDDDGSAMTASIEASPVDIGEGDRFMFISKLIPDLSFQGSTAGAPSVDMTLGMQDFPGGPYVTERIQVILLGRQLQPPFLSNNLQRKQTYG